MIKVVLSPDAVLDYGESFSWYAKRSRKSALQLEEEVAAAIDRIAGDHGACSRFDDVYHYTRLKRFRSLSCSESKTILRTSWPSPIPVAALVFGRLEISTNHKASG